MIEFTLNRNRNGKKSRWAKRYPRKRILKRGSEKAAGWYFHNWYDDGYHYFHGDLHKFLLKNVGRPVDKVFSEFLQRCRRGTEKYNLREWFYDMFEEKENIDYRGGFYLLTDGYKLDHRRQYPEGTEYVYSNWTPRSCHYYPEAEEGAVVFGIQYFIKEYLMKQFQEDFFNKPKDVAVAEFKRRVDTFLGPNNVGTRHIEELHDLGYLPIRIKALPEGTLCPIRVPALTFINTHPDFFWLTNYFETLISATLWLPMTSATTARLYKKELIRHARKTGFKDVDLNFLIHDFSMRGMAGVEAAIMSGMGHMTSFCGSETIPAIAGLEEYYNADAEKELIAATIPATEHSVMCAGGKEDELETFRRLITEVYPTGFVSIVSDTWDFWKVMTEYLPKLKDEILARDGRLVIRPDSGDPVHIIAGYKHEDFETWQEQTEVQNRMSSTAEWVGAYQVLWDIFGGTVNEKGYKVLNPKVGIIYGDSITLERKS